MTEIKRFGNVFIEYEADNSNQTEIIYYGSNMKPVCINLIKEYQDGMPNYLEPYIGSSDIFDEMLKFLLEDRAWQHEFPRAVLGTLTQTLVYYDDVYNGSPETIRAGGIYDCNLSDIIENLVELDKGDEAQYNFDTDCWEYTAHSSITDIPESYIDFDQAELEAEQERRA